MKKTRRFKWFLIPIIGLGLLISIFLLSARYHGVKQEIGFTSDIKNKGILLRPETPGPHPAIVLLHGAGEKHQGHNKHFFKYHANAFLKKGFAVLVYTKRGSSDNNIDYKYFTYRQLLNDALAAVTFLRNQEDINPDNIGLMGVSESGWFTPELAYLDGKIKFIINRVSSPFSVTKTVSHERRMDALNEGFTEEEIEEEILPLTKEIWQFYIDVYRDHSQANGPKRELINEKLKKVQQHERLGKWFTHDRLSEYDSLLYSAKGQNYAYNPLPYLNKIDVPMLYVMGGKDINMPTADIVEFLTKFRENENKDISIKVYPKASHYLYKWGLEDGPYEGWLYQKGYLELISGWAAEQVN